MRAGAYRIGAGDGSDSGSEWVSGHALADQLALLARSGITGVGLYRYASLFDNPDYPALAESEAAAPAPRGNKARRVRF